MERGSLPRIEGSHGDGVLREPTEQAVHPVLLPAILQPELVLHSTYTYSVFKGYINIPSFNDIFPLPKIWFWYFPPVFSKLFLLSPVFPEVLLSYLFSLYLLTPFPPFSLFSPSFLSFPIFLLSDMMNFFRVADPDPVGSGMFYSNPDPDPTNIKTNF